MEYFVTATRKLTQAHTQTDIHIHIKCVNVVKCGIKNRSQGS